VASDDVRDLVCGLLASQRFAVLSTQSPQGPHASLIAFWAAQDLRHLVFATMRATRKFAHLSADPRVAFLFDDRSNRDVDVSLATAVTATGRAQEVTEEHVWRVAAESLLSRHPQLASFVASPGCALVQVVVERYLVVTRFQDVVELPMSTS